MGLCDEVLASLAQGSRWQYRARLGGPAPSCCCCCCGTWVLGPWAAPSGILKGTGGLLLVTVSVVGDEGDLATRVDVFHDLLLQVAHLVS